MYLISVSYGRVGRMGLLHFFDKNKKIKIFIVIFLALAASALALKRYAQCVALRMVDANSEDTAIYLRLQYCTEDSWYPLLLVFVDLIVIVPATALGALIAIAIRDDIKKQKGDTNNG